MLLLLPNAIFLNVTGCCKKVDTVISPVVRFKPKYGELRSRDQMLRDAIAAAQHDDTAVWREREVEYIATIESALNLAAIDHKKLKRCSYLIDPVGYLVPIDATNVPGSIRQDYWYDADSGKFYSADLGMPASPEMPCDLDVFNRLVIQGIADIRQTMPLSARRMSERVSVLDRSAVITSCGHTFCASCLVKYRSYSSTCPHCRAEISKTPRMASVADRIADQDCGICKEGLQLIVDLPARGSNRSTEE